MAIAEAISADLPPDLSKLCLGTTEHAPLPMATVEGATHIVRYVNPAFCIMMRQVRAQLLGKPLSELLPDKDECVAILDRVFRSGKPESHTEKQEDKPHSVFWSYTVWPVQADERLVGILIQVTETAEVHGAAVAMNQALILSSLRQHELIEEAENLNEKLRAEITERQRAEAALLESDRSKDEFLAMLAHELRNPLAPIRNAAEILCSKEAGAEAFDLAQGIFGRQIENMSRMIDDLLDVSRITEGKIELRRQVVALDTIFTAAAHLVRPGIDARAQELSITLPSDPIFLNADATRLEQIFGNLLNNACRYSGRGSHISFSAERAPVTGDDPPEVVIRVRDEGIGIAPDLLPRVFDLFVQASRALDRSQGGLGIGLTLVQRLVHLHGGTVEALSAGLGLGSEFIVRLPILPSRIHVPPPPTTFLTRDTPRRMLIVDDNEDSANSMAMLQRLRGHDTHTAFTGLDALIAAAAYVPEVILLDIGLPGMDGYEVARRLRTMPALASAFIVAVTGYDSDEDRAEARAAGFDEYLVKPVDTKLLREWLRTRV